MWKLRLYKKKKKSQQGKKCSGPTFHPSWSSADPLWKIYYTDFLITSYHSSVTAPFCNQKLESMRADLKGASGVRPCFVVKREQTVVQSFAVSRGPPPLLVLPLTPRFKHKRALARPFFILQHGPFSPRSHLGMVVSGSCDSADGYCSRGCKQ